MARPVPDPTAAAADIDAPAESGRPAAPADEAAPALRWLETDPAAAAERRLLDLLDRFPRHAAIHAAMIAGPPLPPAVAAKLLPLVAPALAAELRARHALPAEVAREAAKRGRDRPDWWQRHLIGRVR